MNNPQITKSNSKHSLSLNPQMFTNLLGNIY